ncbi:MAG TPA: hypothetical protein VFN71_01005 [Methylomirabilota bacterium]|nr:hypothetical protein [Methylomirabilota bacterium]
MNWYNLQAQDLFDSTASRISELLREAEDSGAEPEAGDDADETEIAW